MDILSKDQRHKNMAAIHSVNTKPEMIVRKYLFAHGFRYRLNHPRLPGRPDIVLRKYRTCIFINGCFWHGHEGCKYYVIPKSNTEFWTRKITRNIERDKRVQQELARMGWHCMTIWECELKPKKREQTLLALEYTLNHIYLKDHTVSYSFDEEEKPLMAAEESEDTYHTIKEIQSFSPMNKDTLEFVTYCIGSLSRILHLPQREVYNRLKQSGILYEYIVPSYDVLHTFGSRYLMEDLIDSMKEKGVLEDTYHIPNETPK